MSADGELYINENCRDCFEKELNEWFGNNWKLDYGDFIDFWNLSEMPNEIEINVLDYETEEIIGKVKITNKFYVADNGYGKYVACEPNKIELIKKY